MGAVVVRESVAADGGWVLPDVDPVVDRGEQVCPLGPSGSEKTALLGLGADRDEPDGGAVDV